jgi:hypothetical protein
MADAGMAVLIALLALAPFCLIAVAGRYWIQRAPSDRAAKRRRTLFWIFLASALAIFGNSERIRETKLWRLVSRTCTIVVSNQSGAEVTDLDLIWRATGDPQAQTNHVGSMGNRGRMSSSTRANEFAVESLTGAIGSNRFSFSGTARKGERLVISIEGGGKIVARVE